MLEPAHRGEQRFRAAVIDGGARSEDSGERLGTKPADGLPADAGASRSEERDPGRAAAPPAGDGRSRRDDHGDDAEHATALSIGASLTGAIEVYADSDWFALELVRGKTYSMAATSDGVPVLTLFDMRGELLTASDTQEPVEGYAANTRWSAAHSETYYLRVASLPNSTLAYELRVWVSDDHGNDRSVATPLVVEEPMEGRIEIPQDDDYFAVELTAGTAYLMTTACEAGSTRLLLSDASGAAIGSHFGFVEGEPSGGARIEWIAASTGTFYLLVQDAVTDVPAPAYTLTVEPLEVPEDDHGDDAAHATELVLGAPARGQIGIQGDSDWFSIDLLAGELYFVGATAAHAITVHLNDAKGTILASGTRVEWRAAEGGRYFVEVVSWAESPLDYHLDARRLPSAPDDHGDGAATATELALGAPVAGRLEFSRDVDWFAIALESGQRYEFTTSTDGDSQIALYDAESTQLELNDDDSDESGLHSRLRWTATATATHYIEVSGHDHTASEVLDYQLEARELLIDDDPPTDDHGNDAASASPLPLGMAIAGRLEPAGNADWFAVELVQGESYVFSTSISGEDADSVLTLYDGQLQELSYNDDDEVTQEPTRASRIDWTATSTGVHYLVVTQFVDLFTMDYMIRATPAP